MGKALILMYPHAEYVSWILDFPRRNEERNNIVFLQMRSNFLRLAEECTTLHYFLAFGNNAGTLPIHWVFEPPQSKNDVFMHDVARVFDHKADGEVGHWAEPFPQLSQLIGMVAETEVIIAGVHCRSCVLEMYQTGQALGKTAFVSPALTDLELLHRGLETHKEQLPLLVSDYETFEQELAKKAREERRIKAVFK